MQPTILSIAEWRELRSVLLPYSSLNTAAQRLLEKIEAIIEFMETDEVKRIERGYRD